MWTTHHSHDCYKIQVLLQINYLLLDKLNLSHLGNNIQIKSIFLLTFLLLTLIKWSVWGKHSQRGGETTLTFNIVQKKYLFCVLYQVLKVKSLFWGCFCVKFPKSYLKGIVMLNSIMMSNAPLRPIFIFAISKQILPAYLTIFCSD